MLEEAFHNGSQERRKTRGALNILLEAKQQQEGNTSDTAVVTTQSVDDAVQDCVDAVRRQSESLTNLQVDALQALDSLCDQLYQKSDVSFESRVPKSDEDTFAPDYLQLQQMAQKEVSVHEHCRRSVSNQLKQHGNWLQNVLEQEQNALIDDTDNLKRSVDQALGRPVPRIIKRRSSPRMLAASRALMARKRGVLPLTATWKSRDGTVLDEGQEASLAWVSTHKDRRLPQPKTRSPSRQMASTVAPKSVDLCAVWDEEDVIAWLAKLSRLPDGMATAVRQNGITGRMLLSLDEEKAAKLKLEKYGYRKILLLAAQDLQEAAGEKQPERRQCGWWPMAWPANPFAPAPKKETEPAPAHVKLQGTTR